MRVQTVLRRVGALSLLLPGVVLFTGFSPAGAIEVAASASAACAMGDCKGGLCVNDSILTCDGWPNKRCSYPADE